MSITASDLAAIRDEIGSADPPSDAELGERWERLGESVPAVVLTVLRDRLNTLVASSAMVDVVGVYRHDSRSNIEYLERRIAEVSKSVDSDVGDAAIQVATLKRSDRDVDSWR